jgi:drug/metabolite transporter (DMT)-like permease
VDGRVIGISAALGSAFGWAMGSILFKQLGDRIPPLAMTLAKGLVSGILLGIVATFTELIVPSPTNLGLLIASGVLGIAIGDTCFFAALQYLSPHTLVVLLMSGQVLTAILAIVFLGERPSVQAIAGIITVTIGIGIVVWPDKNSESSPTHWRGIAFGLLSVLCMSGSLIIAKPALNGIPTIEATFIRMVAGTLGIACFGTISHQLSEWTAPFRDRQTIWLFIFAVIIVTFGGFWLSLVAIKYIDLSIANTLNSTEPIFVLPLSAIILHEKIQRQALIGTSIAMLGVVLICSNVN